jgi:endonuclease/exonuclease/phosphatase (EEP) superfamily protein YafD
MKKNLIFMNRLVIYFFYILTIAIALLSLLGYLGKFNMYLELLTNFKLQLFLLSLIVLVFFILKKRLFWIFFASFCLLINSLVVLPWYINVSDIPENNSNNLKVFVFNVLHNNKKYQQTISLVNKEAPDIAVFLEATSGWSKNLDLLYSNYKYHFSSSKLQMEIYSKIPLNHSNIDVYGDYRGVITSDINIAGQELVFIATHAYPQLYYGIQGFQIRNDQLLQGIGNHVNQISKPVIVVGDLNATMWSPFYQEMIKISGLKNARQGFGVLPTQSSFSPNISWLSIPLDHCLVSDKIKVKNIKIVSNMGSDHLPLIIKLSIPKY